MTAEHYLWGGFGILLVFVLNQVFGRLFGEWLSRAGKSSREGVTREEHAMCERHNASEFHLIRQEIERARNENEQGHARLYDKLEVLTTMVRSNGYRGGADK